MVRLTARETNSCLECCKEQPIRRSETPCGLERWRKAESERAIRILGKADNQSFTAVWQEGKKFGRQMTYSPDEIASIRRKIAEVCSAQIGETGLEKVSARSVAKGMRKTAGWLYTMYEDFDEIINAANLMTLKELNGALSRDASDQDSTPAVDKLSAFANSYLVFARSHPERCAALFAPMPISQALRPALETGFRSLVSHLETPLTQIMPDVDSDTINATAKTVFTALHAIVSLDHRDRPAYSLDDALDNQLRSFVNAIAAGYSALHKDRRAGR